MSDHDHDHDHRGEGGPGGHAHHDHAHAHAHGASPTSRAPASALPAGPGPEAEKVQARRLLIVLVVIASFFVVELVGARAAQSDVLEADAFHLLMDVLALGISLGAIRLAARRPSSRFTFGLRRAEPIAALLNGALVLGVAVELVHDGIEHLSRTTTPKSGIMLIVASAALVVNGISAWVLHGAMHVHGGHAHGHSHGHSHGHGHDHDHDHDHDHEGHEAPGHAAHLNMRGAWLHLMGDALGSVSAFVAGLAMKLGAPPIVDPLASFIVVAILVIGAVRLLRDALYVLLEAAPKSIPVEKVRKLVVAQPGVTGIHALHVWSLGTGHDAITVHVMLERPDATIASKIGAKLRQRFAAEYVTVQVEVEGAHP